MCLKIHAITKEYLEEQYVLKKKRTWEIAKEFGCHPKTILNRLNEFGIPKQPRGGVRKYPIVDLSGQIINSLLVLNKADNVIKNDNELRYNCKCLLCGNIVPVRAYSLRTSLRKTCGCKQRGKFSGYGEIHRGRYNNLRREADKKGRKFTLSIEFLWNLFLKQNRLCALSGQLIFFSKEYNVKKGQLRTTASLDRIDSSKDYTEDNVQWVHKYVNIMKQDMLDDEFIQWCQFIVDFNDKNQNNQSNSKTYTQLSVSKCS